MKKKQVDHVPYCSGGSRISSRGVDLRCGSFSVKMYAEMEELGPVGGRVPEFFACRSATALLHSGLHYINKQLNLSTVAIGEP